MSSPRSVGVALLHALGAVPPTRRQVQMPGVVESYNALTNTATVALSDGGVIDVKSLIGTVADGQRVMVTFDRPRGVFVTSTY